jgi:hypothetical protein
MQDPAHANPPPALLDHLESGDIIGSHKVVADLGMMPAAPQACPSTLMLLAFSCELVSCMLTDAIRLITLSRLAGPRLACDVALV